MPRAKKESTLWREIAEKIAAGRWGRFGLCYEIYDLYTRRAIDWATAQALRARINLHQDASSARFELYAFEEGEADTRVLAALFLALEAEDEGQ